VLGRDRTAEIGGGAVDDLLHFLMLVGRRRVFGVDVEIAVADMSEHGHDGVLVDRLDRLFNRLGERLHLVDGEADVGADAGRGRVRDLDAGIANPPDRSGRGARARDRRVGNDVLAERFLEQLFNIGAEPLAIAPGGFHQDVEGRTSRKWGDHTFHQFGRVAIIGVAHHLEGGQFTAKPLARQIEQRPHRVETRQRRQRHLLFGRRRENP